MFVSTLVLGKGGNSLNPIQASENIVILETNDCTSSVPTLYRKRWCLIFDSGMMTRRESRALLVEEWNFILTYASVVQVFVEGLAGTFIGSFFFAPRHFFSVWTVCVSFDGSHF